MSRLYAPQSAEPAQIGTWLRNLAEQVEAISQIDVKGFAAVTTDQLREALRTYMHARRARDSLFGADLFADPAWDLLLDLLLSDLDQRRVSISSACLASAVPPTTALRWIGQLETRGLVRRAAVPSDRRSSHLILTPVAREALLQWAQRHLIVRAPAEA